MDQRKNWPDYAKGIAIILVVLCHTANGITNAGIAVAPKFWAAVCEICYIFMVPVFFFLSGYFSQKSGKTPRSRLIHIGATVLFPFLVWGTIQHATIVMTGSANVRTTWGDLPLSMIKGGPMQFWFLYTLCLLLLLDWFWRKLAVSNGLRLLIALAVTQILPLWVDYKSGALYRPLTSYIYFEVGCFLASVSLPTFTRPQRFALGMAGIVGLVALYLAGCKYATPLRPGPAFLGIAACIAFSTLIPNTKEMQWLRKLGRFSLQIYCLHLFFAAGVRIVMVRLGYTEYYGHVLLGFLSAMVGSVLVAAIDEKWFGWWFRFPTRSRPAEKVLSEKAHPMGTA